MVAPNDIGKRTREIYDLLATDNVSQAVKRMMDFVRDFSDKENLREVIVISAAYHRLEKDERRHTVHSEQLEHRRNRLILQALELIDGIVDELSMHIAA